MSHPLSKAEKMIRATAALARRRGLDPSKLKFTTGDLGDLYHVYGNAATPAKFLAQIERKNR